METIKLQQIADGVLQEKAQRGLQDVFKNMQDPNTPWKNKRELIIKLKFTQNEERDDANCDISVETKLAHPKPVTTRFAVGTDLETGEVEAYEYGSGIKGQMNINDVLNQQETVVDTDTGEIKKDAVVDFRNAKQA